MAREGRAFEVFYRRSTDNGVTWSEEMMLSDDDIEGSGSPQIAVNGDNVFVVWSDCRGSSVKELYYANSSDNGETWSENKALTSDDGFNSEWPLVALDEDMIHIVWGDERDGQHEVYYRNSNDGGATWSEERRLTNWTLGTDGPDGIDIYEFYVHVLLTRYVGNWESFYTRSEDGGSTWSSPIPIVDMDGRNSESRDLSASGSMVNICWMDAKSSVAEIFYRNSTDNGITWNPEVRISNSSVEAEQCHMAISPPDIHFAWYDKKAGNAEIFYRNSTDMAVSWNEEVRLTYVNGLSAQPRIELSGNYIHLVWLDKRFGDPRILYKRHPDFGADTTPPQAPVLLSASLTNNSRDVQLGWSPSSDEGSVGGTIQYSVFRSDKIEGPYGLLSRINASASPFYVWTDQGAGEGDPNNYFYRVCAADTGDNTACAENQAGKFTRALSLGPNLVSIPLIQSNESIETALQTVRYDKAWSYDSLSGKWRWHMGFKSYKGGLWSVNHTLGIWVNVTSDSNLTVAGMVPAQTTIHLMGGWNLVGFPSFNSTYTVSSLKTSAGVVRVEAFDSASPPHHLRIPNDTEPMQLGYGYWIKAEMETTWTIKSS
ncbi:MAG: exo-alpha-sialidase [Thermoplasmata archaeon]|nr:exo-alpha-sialidase [Thermoplasmata archaeon]